MNIFHSGFNRLRTVCERETNSSGTIENVIIFFFFIVHLKIDRYIFRIQIDLRD